MTKEETYIYYSFCKAVQNNDPGAVAVLLFCHDFLQGKLNDPMPGVKDLSPSTFALNLGEIGKKLVDVLCAFGANPTPADLKATLKQEYSLEKQKKELIQAQQQLYILMGVTSLVIYGTVSDKMQVVHLRTHFDEKSTQYNFLTALLKIFDIKYELANKNLESGKLGKFIMVLPGEFTRLHALFTGSEDDIKKVVAHNKQYIDSFNPFQKEVLVDVLFSGKTFGDIEYQSRNSGFSVTGIACYLRELIKAKAMPFIFQTESKAKNKTVVKTEPQETNRNSPKFLPLYDTVATKDKDSARLRPATAETAQISAPAGVESNRI